MRSTLPADWQSRKLLNLKERLEGEGYPLKTSNS